VFDRLIASAEAMNKPASPMHIDDMPGQAGFSCVPHMQLHTSTRKSTASNVFIDMR
jgi:hypothetical protein